MNEQIILGTEILQQQAPAEQSWLVSKEDGIY